MVFSIYFTAKTETCLKLDTFLKKKTNNMIKAIENGASWGYFDWPGYQEVPTNWGIETEHKIRFFNLLEEITLK